MADVTIDDILLKLQEFVQTFGDEAGLVLTDEKYVENDEQFYDLFIGEQGQTEAHGVLISLIGFEQEAESPFVVRIDYKIAIEFLYPYKFEPVNIDGINRNSHYRARKLVDGFRRFLNLDENSKLQLGQAVTHQLLQSEVDWAVKRWGGGSNVKKRSHYIPTELIVNLREKRKPCP